MAQINIKLSDELHKACKDKRINMNEVCRIALKTASSFVSGKPASSVPWFDEEIQAQFEENKRKSQAAYEKWDSERVIIHGD